jgi:hypothetical protein
MNGNAVSPRRAGPAAMAVIAAALVLAACGGSSGSGGGSSAASRSTASGGGSRPAATTASVPFPIGVGDTWKYKSTYGTTVNRITAVQPVSGGKQVTMHSAITSLGSTSHHTAFYLVHPDGSISLPFSQFNTGRSTSSVRLISGNIFWPPADQLSSGRAFHDVLRIEFSADGLRKKITAHVTVRGGGSQSVTVPAGSYRADVVNMTMSEAIEGFSVSTVVKTWLAPGVGPVRSEVVLHEGGTDHVAAKDQLISFKAG